MAGWRSLLERRTVTGASIFDLQIVASMLAYGITIIYTYNSGAFEVFPELKVVQPA